MSSAVLSSFSLRFQLYLHQQYVNFSGTYMETSMTNRSTSHVLRRTSRFFQTPLALGNLLPDAARVFAGASECTCGIGGELRFLRELMYRRHKLWSCWYLSTGIWESWRAAGTAAQLCVNLVLYSHHCDSWCHISTRHIVHHIHLYYSHKIHSIIISIVLFKSFYTYTYSQSGQR